MKYLGIDYGDAKIGIAVGTSDVRIATPLAIIPRTPDCALVIKQRMVQEGADEAIVGLPLSLSGAENPQTAKVRAFIAALHAQGIATQVQDERFTTAGAVATGDDDASAAALMLQIFLDRTR